jgi:hypothetical protein
MGFWSNLWHSVTDFFASDRGVDFGDYGGRGDAEPPEPGDYDRSDNGLPEGWHFVGVVDLNGNHTAVDDSVTDQQIRDADRVFIVKIWPDHSVRYRQFSSANSKDAIGDMLIYESDDGSPV